MRSNIMKQFVAMKIHEKYPSYFKPRTVYNRTSLRNVGVRLYTIRDAVIPEDACILLNAAEKFGDLVVL